MMWAKKQDCIDTLGRARLPRGTHAVRSIALLPVIVVDTLLTWQERATQRRALCELDDRMLKDIGVSALDAQREARKPFWRV